MKTSAAVLGSLMALTLSLSACDAFGQDAGPSTTTQDAPSDSSTQSARPTTADSDGATSTGGDLDATTATGLPNDGDQSTATGADLGDSDVTTSTLGDGDFATSSGGVTPRGTEEEAPSEAPKDSSLPEFSLEASEGEVGSESDLLSTTVRIGVHPDYDRVVFDLEGDGTPGYRVAYVDSAFEDGSGAMVDVEGDAILQVVMTGTRYPGENETFEGGPGTYSLDATEEVEEVRLSGTFEGTTQAFIGVDDTDTPFRAFVLSNPARLVVDVAHSG